MVSKSDSMQIENNTELERLITEMNSRLFYCLSPNREPKLTKDKTSLKSENFLLTVNLDYIRKEAYVTIGPFDYNDLVQIASSNDIFTAYQCTDTLIRFKSTRSDWPDMTYFQSQISNVSIPGNEKIPDFRVEECKTISYHHPIKSKKNNILKPVCALFGLEYK